MSLLDDVKRDDDKSLLDLIDEKIAQDEDKSADSQSSPSQESGETSPAEDVPIDETSFEPAPVSPVSRESVTDMLLGKSAHTLAKVTIDLTDFDSPQVSFEGTWDGRRVLAAQQVLKHGYRAYIREQRRNELKEEVR